ncbi:MAG: hypothetical protein Q7S92_01475 [Candidatus Diapherotrites archaeon]|nr:hypothetical protein [Candidatus Diapherotrites archaeon]
MNRQYTRRLNGKTFRLIGMGGTARAWEISKLEGKRKKGTIIRTPIHRRNLVPERRLHTRLRYLSMKLAYELFPRRVIRVTDLDSKKNRIRSKKTKPDKVLQEAMAVWQKANKKRAKAFRAMDAGELSWAELQARIFQREVEQAGERLTRSRKTESVRQLKKDFEETGFRLDANPANISIANPSRPAAYEVELEHPEKIREYLKQNKGWLDKEKYKRIKRMLDEYGQVHKQLWAEINKHKK